MSATEAKIAAWQKAVGIEPAKGGRADILDALSKAALRRSRSSSEIGLASATATATGTAAT